MAAFCSATLGSSPLTRGKRPGCSSVAVGSGLIPAHAGKTEPRAGLQRSRRAHPRSRGENQALPSALNPNYGSSPLTRGKLPRFTSGWEGTGLIPAHAGKTAASQEQDPKYSAHPRSRGENRMPAWITATPCGSSPLTRGKLAGPPAAAACKGLIPAHAGKTGAGAGCSVALGAHPRSRGENAFPLLCVASVAGSSPLTRGKPALVRTSPGLAGLIPAHAGKTLPDLRFYCADRSDLGKP